MNQTRQESDHPIGLKILWSEGLNPVFFVDRTREIDGAAFIAMDAENPFGARI